MLPKNSKSAVETSEASDSLVSGQTHLEAASFSRSALRFDWLGGVGPDGNSGVLLAGIRMINDEVHRSGLLNDLPCFTIGLGVVKIVEGL